MSYLKLFLCYIIVVLDNLFLLMNNKALVEMGVLFFIQKWQYKYIWAAICENLP